MTNARALQESLSATIRDVAQDDALSDGSRDPTGRRQQLWLMGEEAEHAAGVNKNDVIDIIIEVIPNICQDPLEGLAGVDRV